MKRIAAVALAAAAVSVSAQTPAPPYPPPAPARPALGVDYAPHPQAATLVSVRAPEGTPCRIADERGLVAEGGAPLTVRAHPGALYRVEIRPAGRPPLSGEVAASAGQVASAWAPLALPPPRPVARPEPMDPDAFDDLLQALGRGGPEGQLLERVRSAARRNYFVVEQVLDLLDAFTFGNSRVKVVEVTHERILDREHEGRILDRFTFPPERERVQRILTRR